MTFNNEVFYRKKVIEALQDIGYPISCKDCGKYLVYSYNRYDGRELTDQLIAIDKDKDSIYAYSPAMDAANFFKAPVVWSLETAEGI